METIKIYKRWIKWLVIILIVFFTINWLATNLIQCSLGLTSKKHIITRQCKTFSSSCSPIWYIPLLTSHPDCTSAIKSIPVNVKYDSGLELEQSRVYLKKMSEIDSEESFLIDVYGEANGYFKYGEINNETYLDVLNMVIDKQSKNIIGKKSIIDPPKAFDAIHNYSLEGSKLYLLGYIESKEYAIDGNWDHLSSSSDYMNEGTSLKRKISYDGIHESLEVPQASSEQIIGRYNYDAGIPSSGVFIDTEEGVIYVEPTIN